jgi:hypothetical protein
MIHRVVEDTRRDSTNRFNGFNAGGNETDESVREHVHSGHLAAMYRASAIPAAIPQTVSTVSMRAAMKPMNRFANTFTPGILPRQF